MSEAAYRLSMQKGVALPLDVLDALVGRCLPSCVPPAAGFSREQTTLGSVRYGIHHESLGKLILLNLYKAGERASVLEVYSPLAPPLCMPTCEELEALAAIADPLERQQARIALAERVWGQEDNLCRQRREQQTHLVQALLGLLERDPLWQVAERLDRSLLSGEADRSWEQVPDTSYDREIVRLWDAGYTTTEIAERVGKDPKTINNRLSELRRLYGEEIVPYRRLGRKSG